MYTDDKNDVYNAPAGRKTCAIQGHGCRDSALLPPLGQKTGNQTDGGKQRKGGWDSVNLNQWFQEQQYILETEQKKREKETGACLLLGVW